MRVLLVSWEYPPLVIGGLGRHVQHLAAHLAAAGHDVTVLCRQPTGTDAISHPGTDEVRDGVRVVAVAEDPLHLEFGADLVAWTLALGHTLVRAGLGLGWRPEVVHAHDWLVAHAAIALADHFGVPLVATLHATEAGRHGGWLSAALNRQIHSVEWWLANRADALITCSRSMRQEVTELFHPDIPVTVLHNGIEPDEPATRASTPGAPILLYVGRLEYEKGVQDAIAALVRVRRHHPGARLVVAGAGTQGGWLREQARTHRVLTAVRFTGHLDRAQLRQWFAQADVVVLPSHYEPFGLVALEAACLGVPLVVSTAGGLGEAVRDGVSGLTFAPGDVTALAGAVVAVLDDPVAARARTATARARAAGVEFDWTTIAADTARLYRTTVRRPPVPLGRPVIIERALTDR